VALLFQFPLKTALIEVDPQVLNPLQLPLDRGRANTAPPLSRGGWEGVKPCNNSGMCLALIQLARKINVIFIANWN